MNDNMRTFNELALAWRELFEEARKNKKVKFEKFNPTFSQTYALLVKQLPENSLNRECMAMVAQAYLFANIQEDSVDSASLAAFVLTERMLAYCAFGNSNAATEPSTIYVAELRREISLDFNDVDESVLKLAKLFEEMFWKKVKA